jgi:hypothetical protein
MLPSPHSSQKWLRLLLTVIGCGLLVATIPIFFPVSLMATIHGWLGLGKFPDAPITIYLARSTSLLYAVHGAVFLFVSFDLDRYRPLVFLLGWLHVVIGTTTFVTDLTAPMPWYWTAIEGVPVAAMGGAILWLAGCNSPDLEK